MSKKSLYECIVDIVCKYFEVTRWQLFYDRSTVKNPQNHARVLATYFIREYTGDKFWAIAYYLKDPETSWAAARYKRAAKRILSKSHKTERFKLQVLEINEKISKRISC
jgi:hypothetical protein